MWPFRRRRRSADAPADATPPEPPAADGWSSLPPVQRAVPPAELTVGATTFEAALASRRPPHPFLAPLGHDVSAAAPSGIVTGLAAPAVQRSAAPDLDLPLPSRQPGRPPERPAKTLPFTAPEDETPAGEATEAAAALAVGPPVRELPTAQRVDAPGLTTAPPMDLPPVPLPVARLAAAPTPAPAPAPPPAPPVETSQISQSAAEPDPEGGSVERDAQGETAPLLGSSGGNETSFIPQPAGESTADQTAEPATAPPPAVQRSTIAEPPARPGAVPDTTVMPLRRLGFGPPLPPDEPRPLLQRSADPAPVPPRPGEPGTTASITTAEKAPAVLAPTAESVAPDEPPSEAPAPLVGERTLIAGDRTAEDVATPPVSPPPSPETLVPAVQRLATPEPTPDTSPVEPPSNEPIAVVPTSPLDAGPPETSTGSPPQDEQTVAPPMEEPPAPLVGEQHLVDMTAPAAGPLPTEAPPTAPAFPLQRAASPDTPVAPLSPRSEAAAIPSALPSTSPAVTSGAVAVQRLPVLSVRAQPAALRGVAAGTPVPTGRLSGAQVPADVTGLPLQLRSQTGDVNAERSLPSCALFPAHTVSRMAAAGPVSTIPALPLASAVSKASTATAVAASGGFETWSFEPPAPSAETAATPGTVQRAAEDDLAAPPPVAGPPAAAGAAPLTPPGGSGPGAAATPEQLDELARRLYDKIRYRLKAELRLDRERAGLLTDLRR